MRAISISTSDGRLLAGQAWAATGTVERARGWLCKASVESGEAMLISPAASIHSFGMRFHFDLAFLDRQGQVLKVCPDIAPGQVAFGPWRAWFTWAWLQALELPAGALKAHDIQVGQVLQINDRHEGTGNA